MLEEFRYSYYLYRWLRATVWLGLLGAALFLWWLSGGLPPLALQILFVIVPRFGELWSIRGPSLLFFLAELFMFSLLSLCSWAALLWACLRLARYHWRIYRLRRLGPVSEWFPTGDRLVAESKEEGNEKLEVRATSSQRSRRSAVVRRVQERKGRQGLLRSPYLLASKMHLAMTTLLQGGVVGQLLRRQRSALIYVRKRLGARKFQVIAQDAAPDLSLAVSVPGGHTTMNDALTYSLPRMRLPQKIQLTSSRSAVTESLSLVPKRVERTEPLASVEQWAGQSGPLAAVSDAPTRPALPPATALPRQLSMRPLEVGIGWHTGITRQRNPNEDSLVLLQGTCTYYGQLVPFGLFVVADGMGGHECGQEASRIAMQSMMHTVLQNIVVGNELTDEFLADMLIGGVEWANRAIYQRSREWHKDMGTTLTAALVVGTKAYVVNVGDSRTYIYRDEGEGGGLLQITHDHSVVARLAALGQIAPHEIYTHPDRNQVYRSVGTDERVEVDWFIADLFSHDRLLLCSDGLWELVRDPEIERILKNTGDPMRASEVLVQLALRGGGTDNVSVIVVAIP